MEKENTKMYVVFVKVEGSSLKKFIEANSESEAILAAKAMVGDPYAKVTNSYTIDDYFEFAKSYYLEGEYYYYHIAGEIISDIEENVPDFFILNKDAYELCEKIKEELYRRGKELFDKGAYCNAKIIFYYICDYKDAEDLFKECCYQRLIRSYEKYENEEDDKFFKSGACDLSHSSYIIYLDYEFIKGYKDADDLYEKYPIYSCGKRYMSEEKYEDAINEFEKIEGYKDADDLYKECYYLAGKNDMNRQWYSRACEKFEKIKGYKDSDSLLNTCKQQSERIAQEQKQKWEKIGKKEKLLTILSWIALGAAILFIVLSFIVGAGLTTLLVAFTVFEVMGLIAFFIVRQFDNEVATFIASIVMFGISLLEFILCLTLSK